MGELIDENEGIRQLPFGEIAAKELPEGLRSRLGSFSRHNHCQGPLLPLRMRYGDYGRLTHIWVGKQGIFQIN